MTDDRQTWRLTTARTERLTSGATYTERRGPHWILVLEGAVRLDAAGVAHRLRVGDAVLVAARQPFVLTTRTETVVSVNDLALVVPTHPLPSVFVARGFTTRHRGIAELVRLCPMAAQCGPALMTTSYANLLGSAMTASWLEAQGRSDEEEPRSDLAVAAVVTAVTDRPGEAWTVERMAGLVHLSRSALGERFRRELDLSPAEVLRGARMQEARRLLQAGDGSVGQVAHAVGYGSSAAFSRAFTTSHGVSPQTWRTTLVASVASGPRGPQRGEGDAGRRREPGAHRQGRHDSVRVDQHAS